MAADRTGAHRDGPQAVAVTREGQGNLYYTAYARYFTLEEGIRAAGTDLKVRRRYYRLTERGRAALDGFRLEWRRFRDAVDHFVERTSK